MYIYNKNIFNLIIIILVFLVFALCVRKFLSFPVIYYIIIIDIYTLCRMFAKFDVDKLERGPNNCKVFSTPKNIIFYGEFAKDSKNTFSFISKLIFDAIVKSL